MRLITNSCRAGICSIIIVCLRLIVPAQSETSFRITQSVVAGGGDKSTGSGNLIVEGTAGQPGAGTQLRNPPFSHVGGFWPGTLMSTPTAIPASISGRITTGDGLPLAAVVITLSGSRQARTITDGNGFYSFSNSDVGGLYSVTPSRANYSFTPANRSFSLIANKIDAAFTAIADAVATTNALDMPEYFVRQQYLDFLNREPDQGGFQYWSEQVNQCNSDAACIRARRTGVSAAFFIEQEFQLSGSLVYRFYKVSFGARPTFVQFMADRRRVIGGPDLEANRQRFAEDWVQRSEFLQKYPQNLSGPEFIDSLLRTVRDGSGVDLTSQRDELINDYSSHQSRARTLLAIAENKGLVAAEYHRAFVLMQYFGYLRRDPDEAGYRFWLNVLDSRPPGKFRGMVCSFITSEEYQRRFGSVVTHSNRVRAIVVSRPQVSDSREL